ncbi:hypothetical protein A2U01_0022276, partial [Trifolium medium]|nr:hypothetical protein [Trifolium medium]
DGQEQLPSVSISVEWMLTVSSKVALHLSINQIMNVLSPQQRLGKASMETIGQLGEHVMAHKHLFRKVDNITVNCIANFLLVSNSDIFHMQGLLYAKCLLRKLIDVSEFSSDWERNRDADDTSSDAGSSFVVSQSTSELSEILSQQMFGRGVQSCSKAFWDQGLLLLLMVSEISGTQCSELLRNDQKF